MVTHYSFWRCLAFKTLSVQRTIGRRCDKTTQMNEKDKQKMNGSCHCSAVNFTFHGRPERLVSCNCSICRRLNPLWAHGPEGKLEVWAAPDATIAYVWGDKGLAFHTCKTCGCTTHWKSLGAEKPLNMALNMTLCDPEDLKGIPIRHFDGADSWKFTDWPYPHGLKPILRFGCYHTSTCRKRSEPLR